MKYLKHVLKKEPWQIAAARFVSSCEQGTTLTELKSELESQGYQLINVQVQAFWEEEVVNPPGRRVSRTKVNGPLRSGEDMYQASLELVQKITDYDELKEARKNSFRATVLAICANLIAFLTLGITAIK